MNINTLNEYINEVLSVDDIKEFSSIDREKLESFRPKDGMNEKSMFK